MPPKKGNGKNKLKVINGQPSVLSLVSESSTNTPSHQKKQLKKDRSPPTPLILFPLVVIQRKGETFPKQWLKKIPLEN